MEIGKLVTTNRKVDERVRALAAVGET